MLMSYLGLTTAQCSPSKRHAKTRIQWIMGEHEKQDLYDDLGIIGEISSPEATSNKNFSDWKNTFRGKDCCLLENCKQVNFETPSGTSICNDIKQKRALTRMQRKRSRKHPTAGEISLSAKQVRMDVNNNTSTRFVCESEKDGCLINALPDEIFLKIFGYCNSDTRVLCSRVCWRWHNVANDKCLWQQVSLSKKSTDLTHLQRLLRRGVQVMCLNCADISQNVFADRSNTSFSSLDDSGLFSLSPCRDPFSRSYHYSVHSIDLTNANVSPNLLCLILMRCSMLRNLSLEGLTISHNVLGCLTNCPLLQRLNVCLCHDLTSSGMVELLCTCVNLNELNLAWTNLSQCDPTEIFAELPTGLKSLNISGFRDTLRDEHVISLTERCPVLHELDASDSNLLTGTTVDALVGRLPATLRAVNLSRCYSIDPNCYLRFSRLHHLRYLDVFGVMDDTSIGTLASALPRVRVCLRPFSAIARPAPSALYGTRRRTVWGYYVV